MQEQKDNGFYKWMALFVVIIGTFMSILDSSIVNIAIPKLMAVFGVSLDSVQWILTAYTLALAAIIPLTVYLGEILGTKKLYIIALAMFTMGSLVCGFAWSNSSMIVFRVIQALGGGMIMPVGMSIILEVIPPHERGMAFGFYGIAAMAAPAIGPTLGGFIIEKLDWRMLFLVNVPIGIVGVIMAAIILQPSKTKPMKGFDFIGFASSVIGLVSILYVLGEGSAIDWGNVKNPLLMILGCGSLLIFVVNELTHPAPLLDLRTLKIYDFGMSQVASCVTTFALMGGAYVVPIFLQSMRGYTAMETGLIMLPAALATGVMMPISGALFDKVGVKPVVIPGLIILAISSYYLSFINMNTSKETIIFLLSVRGIALGLAMMPVSTAGMNAVPREKNANASALNNTIRQITSALSITVMTTMINSRLHDNYAKLSGQITSFNPQAANFIKQIQALFTINHYSSAEAQAAATSTLYGMVYKQAYLDAMDYATALSVIAVIVAIMFVLFMSGKKKLASKDDQNEEAGHAIMFE
ncbi:DHA2 family efflux MFS transporter permease subunit [Desulfosporosinus sp. BG]|uniref:DHA2 family efflux MFS transporter permease subunit n=1 Tax=Desulfosporosinus sp. BG TaxID=1633135 RepID=UPI00083B3ADB|nr:DHA2 family efflux MFS transporter permease subunit [Desulfosporosinus sp. BG]ODA40642.1 MFS transporter [Desulfosporosinus sp. BG]